MKHSIDIDTWERKDNYLFFRDFHNSWIAMTSEVDCTEAYAEAKAQGRSFFLYYLYAILRAANEIKEFRYRWDKHGQVVCHDTVDITTPIAVPGKTFYTVRIPWNSDFKAFYEEARRIITSIPEDGDPYGTDKEIAAQGDFDVILLSATPKLYFTSISYTQYAPGHPLDYPLMNAGKAVTREGKTGHAHCTDRKPCLCRRGAHLTVLREGREVPEGKINLLLKEYCYDKKNKLLPVCSRHCHRTHGGRLRGAAA